MMLTFLRKIRKSLIESLPSRQAGGSSRNPTSPTGRPARPLGGYLLYATGEILLVMIGILLALQINNWNEFRKQRLKEKEILSGLVENLELNIQTLKMDKLLLEQYNQSSRIVLSVLDNRLPFVDSLGKHFHIARLPKTNLSLSQSGYEQYKNIGYDIILDNEAKQEIISFFESTFPKWFTKYNGVNAAYVPFIDHHVPLFIYKRKTLVPNNIKNLYDDNYYLGWMRAYMEGRNTLMQEETEFIEENQRVLHLIKEELREFK